MGIHIVYQALTPETTGWSLVERAAPGAGLPAASRSPIQPRKGEMPCPPDFRQLLVRVTRFLVGEAGITQFLDCGAGLPTAEKHPPGRPADTAGRPSVYVDNDPVVITHGRALLVENEATVLVDADILEPGQVLNSDVVRRHLDFSEPIALYHMATFYHYNGRRSPQSIMTEYIDALPSGSYVAISHYYDPETPRELHELVREIQRVFLASP